MKLYDLWEEVVERLSFLGVSLPLKRPLMGRVAWVAVKEGGKKTFKADGANLKGKAEG